MKFRVERDALGEAVAWVARALPSRPVVPVLSGLLLQAGDDVLTLSCFDYEVSARARVEAKVEQPGEALVPGRLLAEVVRSLPGLDVEVAADADMVDVTCGRAEFALVSLPLADYPALPEPPAPTGTVDGEVLTVAAAQVVPAASRDDTLPMLTAVCLEADGDTLTMAATDRYRLAVRQLRWQPTAPGLNAVAMVPARTLAEFGRTVAAGDPVTIAFGAAGQADTGPDGRREGTAKQSRQQDAARDARPAEGLISFEGGSRRLTARLVAGEFIKYQSRFPAEFGSRATLPATSFIEAVRRVSLAADRATPVRLTFGDDGAVVEARTEGRARAREAVPAEFEGEERVISFSPHLLLDGLAAAAAAAPRHPDHDEEHATDPAPDPMRIRLEFSSAARPALITWAADGGLRPGDPTPAFRYLVVPLRVPARG
jgi:DNA polymerase III subunit beta